MRKYAVFLLAIVVSFLILFYLSGKKETVTGPCEARAVVDDEYFRVAIDRILNARKTIDLMMFELVYYPGKHGPSNKLIEALASAKRKGVRVRVLLEGGERFLGKRFAEKVFRTSRLLKDLGIDHHFDRDGETMHAKLMIVDSLWILLGSTNWSYYSLTKNHEANVLIKSRSLALDFINYFEKQWR